MRFVAVDVPTARRLAAGRRAELATLQAQDVAWQPVPLTSPVVMTCGDADKRLVARLSVIPICCWRPVRRSWIWCCAFASMP
ncbi:hypothetical protein LNP25_24360 [Klebsiella variicola subsp. variicola]|nr:hypothetical protein [Klebsiella variicola subsp. variicola]